VVQGISLLVVVAVSALGAFGGLNAHAEAYSFGPTREAEPRVSEDRFRVEVTLLFASIDTQLRIDPSITEQGTLIDAEDDLGLDDAALMPEAEITLLPGKHHLIRLSGFNTRRSASTIIDQEIVFDDEVYEAGERVDSELNLTLFGLTYGYRFIARDRGELTATFGLQITSVEANALVRSRVIRDAESGVAPLPLVGLEGRYDFTAHFGVEGRVQYIGANVEEVDGSIMDARLSLTWRLNPNLVFGLGYRSFSVDIDSANEDNPGLVKFSFDGPTLFARASL
jgi:hypothetical protein